MNTKRINKPLLNVAQIRELEQALFQQHNSYSVMQSAAQELFEVIISDINDINDINHTNNKNIKAPSAPHTPNPVQIKTAHIVLGTGNNAGDGLVLATLLRRHGFNVRVYSVFTREFSGDAQKAHALALAEKVSIQAFIPFDCQADDIIVEAIFGIGLDRPAEGTAKTAIVHLNACKAQFPGIRVYAVDTPAGILADTGAQIGNALYADTTVTFIADKIGLHTADGKACAGKVIVKTLGATDPDFSQNQQTYRYHYPSLSHAACAQINSNKSHYGHALIIGGGRGMFGATALAAVSALKVGAGKSSIYSHHDYATQFHLDGTPLYEVMRRQNLHDLSAYSAVVLGAGLGRDEWGKSVFDKTLHAVAATQSLLLDADGLWHLADSHIADKISISIMTPHEAEAARLLNCHVETIRSDKPAAVRELAKRYRCISVLKGAGTLVSDGKTTWINETGNLCLATAGTGDVLAGMIGGYLAQGMSALEAALYGVYRHGLAADNYWHKNHEKTLRASNLWDY